MESVLSLKRLSLKRSSPMSSVDYKLCIFCQAQKPDDSLRKASEQGLTSVKNATYSRKKMGDNKNVDVIDRLEKVLDTDDAQRLVWHKVCFSTYTDKGKLKRLQKSLEIQHTYEASCSSNAHVSGACRTLRKGVEPVNWNLCLFCQSVNPKQRLRSVMTKKVSDEILQNAYLDYKVGLRVAGVIDLIASEAKYHSPCLKTFMRSTAKTKQDSSADNNLAMVWLCNELKYAAEKGQVLQLNVVWERYVKLAESSSTVIPQSFHSRSTPFKNKLRSHLGDMFEFFQPMDVCSTERNMLLIPTKYKYNAIMKLVEEKQEVDEALTMPRYEPEQEDIFLSLIHVALNIRSDMMAASGHKGFSVSETDAISCVPDSLYMFLRILYGGQTVIEDDNDEVDEADVRSKVLSIAQDLVYGISGGKKWTPKHIGLASTLHQATRSKDLVQLFHKAGHCLSYDQVKQVDTALAETTLQSMDPVTGTVMPPNIVANKFVHYTADNIDILDESLDGKNTFHATQMAAWQRGQTPDVILATLEPSTNHTLNVPDAIGELCPAIKITDKVNPVFPAPVNKAWFDSPAVDVTESIKRATLTDIVFFLQRQQSQNKPGWTVFNEQHSQMNPEQTTLGYMPIILAPAHELDTLNTVVTRCMLMSSRLGQEYTVITVDQALYYKLMELKWAVPEYRNKLIPRLGGLHISMNFLKAIGDHMSGSGLAEIWVESGLFGQGTTELALSGKAYTKAMRAHKLTLQALWRLLMPGLLTFVEQSHKECHDRISAVTMQSSPQAIAELLSLLMHDGRFQQLMTEFVAKKSAEDVNFSFWWQYMDMISILLLFTRAQRDGIWELHLEAFRRMLPYFRRYDHYNYARWGPVYLAEMHQLPATILSEFQKGNFVVKRSARQFNQVDPDQAQEWINGTGKKGGGIVGITKTISALRRWTLSYNLRSHIAIETHQMYNLCPGSNVLHNEGTKARQKRDNDDDALLSTLQRFDVFVDDVQCASLKNIATKDLATDAIQTSLLRARDLGQQQVDTFVQERLVGTEPDGKPKVSIHQPLVKNNALTFTSLYDVVKESKEKDKKTILKADRNILQRLVTAYEAGRSVDLPTILKHELMPVPVSLAEMNGVLRTGNKSMLADVLTEGINCPETIDLHAESSCLIIDGQALVVGIGKPVDAVTFGDLADTFVSSILQAGSRYQRVDVVFDRYRDESIKSKTRVRRTKTARPIRRVVENRDVPLPKSWSNFLALPENKADLARFLSEELIANAPPQKEIVVAGGFLDGLEVQSSVKSTDVASLRATHEEADTRLVLHAIQSSCNTVVVSARDTDVLLLLVAHSQHMQCSHLWMMSGTSKKRKYISIGEVYNRLPADSILSLLPFHALTGCDVTSYISNHSKRSAWKVFKDNHALLKNLGVGNFTDEMSKSAEKFVCRIYNVDQTDSIDEARHIMFYKSAKPEALPPTSDALRFHLMRVHYQTLIWRNADSATPELPTADTMGWKRCEGGLEPILMSLSPIPSACLEIISCSCQTQCRNLRCKCRKNGLHCTAVCGCKRNVDQNVCLNRTM